MGIKAGPTSSAAGGGSGQNNTISSLGGGTALTAAVPKVGVDLRTISLAANGLISFSLASDLLTIDTDLIVNADVNAAAAIAMSKLNLAITNTEVAAAAGIAVNKLAALTADRGVESDGSGFLVSTGTGKFFWEELNRTKLTSEADNIQVIFTEKKYLMVLARIIDVGTIGSAWRFNNDTGTNYGLRWAGSSGYTASQSSATSIPIDSGSPVDPLFIDGFIINEADTPKSITYHTNQSPASAAVAPLMLAGFGSWYNTVDQITEIDIVNFLGGGFDTDSEIVVLGHD